MPYADKKVRLQYIKKWQSENKQKVLKYKKKWREDNREKQNILVKKWCKDNRQYFQDRRNTLEYKIWRRGYDKKLRSNPKHRIHQSMKLSIYRYIGDKKNNKKWETLVNYSLKDLVEHLEKQFDEKMNWNNYGSYWQIDHILPISWFIFDEPTDIGFKMCWDINNLQPLEATQNKRKSNKYIPFEIYN